MNEKQCDFNVRRKKKLNRSGVTDFPQQSFKQETKSEAKLQHHIFF